MRTAIAFLAGAAIGAASAIILTDRTLRELIHEGHLAVIDDPPADDGRRPDIGGSGEVIPHGDRPPHDKGVVVTVNAGGDSEAVHDAMLRSRAMRWGRP